MRNAQTNEIAATCRLVGVHMDSVARKATPFPADILERGRGYLREYDFGYRD
jgi:acyl-CoA thioester hydrolase